MIKKLHEWKMSIRDYKHKKGFTLIELIVVMAIIAILVLLAAPRFLGRTEDALATRIKNDITAAETKVDEYLIKHEGLEEWGTSITVGELNGLIEDGTLHARDGVMDSEDAATVKDVPYYKVPASFVGDTVQSDLDGDFYTNEEGEVYYNVGAGGNAGDGVVTDDFELPDQYVASTDDDFLRVEATHAPNGEFYFAYIGNDDYIVIPEVIQGVTITDTYNMFGGWSGWHEEYDRSWWFSASVKGVALKNSNITNTASTFTSLNNGEDWEDLEANDYTLDLTYFNTTGVTDMNYMFGWGPYIDEIILGEHFDTSMVTDMSGMFFGIEGTDSDLGTKVDISQFDTSNVTDMTAMFDDADIPSLDVSSFNTANVTSMSRMFDSTTASILNLSDFDTSKVTTMSSMFNGADATELDISSFDTSNVTSMSNMFYHVDITTVDFSNFDTAMVTSMYGMFEAANGDALDLSMFDTTSVQNMKYMFSRSLFESVDLSSFDTSNVMDMSSMFSQSRIPTLDLRSFEISDSVNLDRMFWIAKATVGLARTQADADKLNTLSATEAPVTLYFSVDGTITRAEAEQQWVDSLPGDYVLAADDDFVRVSTPGEYSWSASTYRFDYVGTDEYVVIPTTIQGMVPEKFNSMFRNNNVVKGVASQNGMVHDMSSMFENSSVTEVRLDTGNVERMDWMFYKSNAPRLDLTFTNLSELDYTVGTFVAVTATEGTINSQLMADTFNNLSANKDDDLTFTVK